MSDIKGVEEIKIELPTEVFDTLEAALPSKCRFSGEDEEGFHHLIIWTPGCRISVYDAGYYKFLDYYD